MPAPSQVVPQNIPQLSAEDIDQPDPIPQLSADDLDQPPAQASPRKTAALPQNLPPVPKPPVPQELQSEPKISQPSAPWYSIAPPPQPPSAPSVTLTPEILEKFGVNRPATGPHIRPLSVGNVPSIDEPEEGLYSHVFDPITDAYQNFAARKGKEIADKQGMRQVTPDQAGTYENKPVNNADIGGIIRKDITRKGGEVGADVAEQLAQTNPMTGEPSGVVLPPQVRGVVRGVGQTAGGVLSDPATYALMAGPTSVIGKALISTGFAYQMGKGAVESAGQLGEVWDNPDIPQEKKIEMGTEAILSAIMAGMSAGHGYGATRAVVNDYLSHVPEADRAALQEAVEARIGQAKAQVEPAPTAPLRQPAAGHTEHIPTLLADDLETNAPESVKAQGDIFDQVAPSATQAEEIPQLTADDVETEPEVATEAPKQDTVVNVPRGTIGEGAAAPTGDIAPGQAGTIPASSLSFDPKRFQYKLNTAGPSGTSNLLRGQRFNENLAGVVQYWRDPADGKNYVVNGHHRAELAMANGPDTPLLVRHLDVADASEARAIGALTNIAEGRGTAVDAAKFMREEKVTPADLEKHGISLGEATAENGLALSKLDSYLFDKVVSGDLSQGRGIAIGRATGNPATQAAVLKLIEKAERRGRKMTDGMVAELARFANRSGETTTETQSLFGNSFRTENNALDKAEVSDYIKGQISKERRLFGSVATDAKAEGLAQGGNVIKTKENRATALAAAQAGELYDKLSASKGPIDDILEQAASRIARRENSGTVKADAYRQIRDELGRTIARTEGTDSEGDKGDARSSEETDQPLFARQAPVVAPTFFSKAERAAEQKLPNSVKADSVLSTLRNAGVKEEELKWIGLDDFLRGKDKVSKQEVADFIRQNNVQVKEVTKGTPAQTEQTKKIWSELTDLVKKDDLGGYDSLQEAKHGAILAAQGREGNDWSPETIAKAKEYVKAQGGEMGAPKHSTHVLPGAEPGSYRELLLTLPEKPGGTQGPKGWGDTAGGTADSVNFRSSHFPEPNILAHVRFNDRTSPDGKKTLFIEEVQSDWHQKGRKERYNPENSKPVFDVKGLRGTTYMQFDTREEAQAFIDSYDEKTRSPLTIVPGQRQLTNPQGVPDAPFKSTWHELAMKRMLRYAAENGYDRVAWTTGEQQNARYDLSQHLSSVEYERRGGDYRINVTDKKTGEKHLVAGGSIPADSLSDYVGKELADKIAASAEPKGQFSGLDLKVGGQGMKGFYDKILPDFMNKYGKKWDAKVGETDIPTGENEWHKREYSGPSDQGAKDRLREISQGRGGTASDQMNAKDVLKAINSGDGFVIGMQQHGSTSLAELIGGELSLPRIESRPAHSMDVTPAMRDSVLHEGQPLFARPKPKPPEGPVLPGFEPHIDAQKESAAATAGEDLSRKLTEKKGDISAKSGEMERNSPLFADSDASDQGKLFSLTPGEGMTPEELKSWVAKAGDDLKVQQAGTQGNLFGEPEKVYRLQNGSGQGTHVTQTQVDALIKQNPQLADKIENAEPAPGIRFSTTGGENGTQPVMSVSRDARDLIGSTPLFTKAKASDFTGVNLPQRDVLRASQAILDAVRKLPEDKQQAGFDLVAEMNRAARESGNRGLALQVEGTPEHFAHEELFHGGQRELGQGSMRHVSDETAQALGIDHPVAQKLHPVLKAMGYDTTDPHQMISEIAAKINSDDQLLNPRDVAEWAGDYFDALHAQHGEEKVADIIKTLPERAREVYANATESAAERAEGKHTGAVTRGLPEDQASAAQTRHGAEDQGNSGREKDQGELAFSLDDKKAKDKFAIGQRVMVDGQPRYITGFAESGKPRVSATPPKVEPEAPRVVPGARSAATGNETKLSEIAQLTKSIAASAPKRTIAERIKAGADLGGRQTGPGIKDTVTSALGRLKGGFAALVDAYKRPPVANDYDTATRNWSGADNISALELQRFAKTISNAVPNRTTQKGMSRWIEAAGDEAKLREWADKSNDRQKPVYEAALKLTDAQKTIARNVVSLHDATLQEAIKAGILEHGVENYIQHMYDNNPKILRKLQGEMNFNALNPNPAFAKARTFPTYFDAEQAGMRPANDGVGNLTTVHERSLRQALATRAYIRGLMEGKAADGRPLIDTSWASAKEIGDPGEEAYLVKPGLKPGEERSDYLKIDHPALRGWRWSSEVDGKPVFVQGDALVHPDIYKKLKNNLGRSAIRDWTPVTLGDIPIRPGAFVLNSISNAKSAILSLSGFHQNSLGLHALEHRTAPAGMPEIDLTDEKQKGLINSGLMVAHFDAAETHGEGLTSGGLMNKVPGVHAYNEYLWKSYQPRLKMAMALNALDRNMEIYGDKLTEQQIYNRTADEANAAFGGLNYRQLGRNKTMQDTLRILLMAPDFTEARARFVGQAARPYGREQLVALLGGAAVLYTTARILNQMSDDNPHWDKPFSVVHKGREYELRTIQGDLLHLAEDPLRFMQNRLSPLIPRNDPFNKPKPHETEAQAWKRRTQGYVPIPAQPWMRQSHDSNAQKAVESIFKMLGVNEKKAKR